jgi:outer membrane protein TolC
MTPRCAALQSAVERAEESLRHVEERARQSVERAQHELQALQSQLELETRRDPHPQEVAIKPTWRWER